MKVTAKAVARIAETRSMVIRISVYGRCQRDSRRCERVQADLGTPLLGGGSCCHSKPSYGMPLRLLLVPGRWRLVVTSPTSSRITYRPHPEHYAPPRPRGLRRAAGPLRAVHEAWDRATIPMDRPSRSGRCARFPPRSRLCTVRNYRINLESRRSASGLPPV